MGSTTSCTCGMVNSVARIVKLSEEDIVIVYRRRKGVHAETMRIAEGVVEVHVTVLLSVVVCR